MHLSSAPQLQPLQTPTLRVPPQVLLLPTAASISAGADPSPYQIRTLHPTPSHLIPLHLPVPTPQAPSHAHDLSARNSAPKCNLWKWSCPRGERRRRGKGRGDGLGLKGRGRVRGESRWCGGGWMGVRVWFLMEGWGGRDWNEWLFWEDFGKKDQWCDVIGMTGTRN